MALEISRHILGKGKISVGKVVTPLVFGATTRSVLITAAKENTGTLYMGDSSVSHTGANAMTYLEAGDTIEIPFNSKDTSIYIVSDVADQNVWYGAIL